MATEQRAIYFIGKCFLFLFYVFGFTYISFFCNICFGLKQRSIYDTQLTCKQIENICPEMFSREKKTRNICCYFLSRSFSCENSTQLKEFGCEFSVRQHENMRIGFAAYQKHLKHTRMREAKGMELVFVFTILCNTKNGTGLSGTILSSMLPAGSISKEPQWFCALEWNFVLKRASESSNLCIDNKARINNGFAVIFKKFSDSEQCTDDDTPCHRSLNTKNTNIRTIYGEKCELCIIYTDSFQFFSSFFFLCAVLFSCSSVNFKRNTAIVLFVSLLSSVRENCVYFFYFLFCWWWRANNALNDVDVGRRVSCKSERKRFIPSMRVMCRSNNG